MALLVLLGAAAAAQKAAPAVPGRRPARPADPQRPAAIGTIKEIMQGIVDPAADVLFEAVAFEVTSAGVQETKPQTEDDWIHIRRNALLLAEASNLLKIPGRRVAPATPIAGLGNEAPGPEDLSPAEIQVLIDADRATFNRLAQGLADAAVLALEAADARSVDALFASGEDIDRACENCHARYWYPKDKQPQAGNQSRRKTP